MTLDETQPTTAAAVAAAGMPAGVLEAEIIDLTCRLSAGTYELLVLLGELDHRGTWAASGALSAAAWLASACDIDIGTARSQIRVARAIRQHPRLAAAMAAGDISYAKARALAPHLSDTNTDALVSIAETTPAGRLGVAIAGWIHRNDNPEDINRRQHEARACSWRCEPDATITITLRLPPAVAGQICAVIDQGVMANNAPAGASLAQQRADAAAAAFTGGTAPPTTEVVVHVGESGNTLTDGTPLTDHAVTSLLPEALISLLIHDTARRPIDASPRRRNPTRRQRRVLDVRQPECAHPGCHATVLLQYDHIHPYSHGGPTTLDNLQRLCGPHNRARQHRAPQDAT